MLIKILAYSDTAEEALNQAREMADQLTGEGMPFLCWSDFEIVPGKDRCGNMPAVLRVSTTKYPVEDKLGLELVWEAMDFTKAGRMELLHTIRHNLSKYTDEEILGNIKGKGPIVVDGKEVDDGPGGLRTACFAFSQSYGTPIRLYGPYGEGILDPGYLQNILDHRPGSLDETGTLEVMDKPLWVVPFDMQF